MSPQRISPLQQRRDLDYVKKMHKRILRFFSKIDSSQQMGPLVNKAIRYQHDVIPGPSRFQQRTAKDIKRVKLLEYYDADCFFSEQALKRLQRMSMMLPGNAFLKLMQTLVAIFDVYLTTRDSKHRFLIGQHFNRFQKEESNRPTESKSSHNSKSNVSSSPCSFKLNRIKLEPCAENIEHTPSSEKDQGLFKKPRKVTSKPRKCSREDNSSQNQNRFSKKYDERLTSTDGNCSLTKLHDLMYTVPRSSNYSDSSHHKRASFSDSQRQHKRRKTGC